MHMSLELQKNLGLTTFMVKKRMVILYLQASKAGSYDRTITTSCMQENRQKSTFWYTFCQLHHLIVFLSINNKLLQSVYPCYCYLKRIEKHLERKIFIIACCFLSDVLRQSVIFIHFTLPLPLSASI